MLTLLRTKAITNIGKKNSSGGRHGRPSEIKSHETGHGTDHHRGTGHGTGHGTDQCHHCLIEKDQCHRYLTGKDQCHHHLIEKDQGLTDIATMREGMNIRMYLNGQLENADDFRQSNVQQQ